MLKRSIAIRRGFSLVEILCAVAVVSMLMLILVNLSGQAGKIWSQGERQNQYRMKARAALEYMSYELKQATLSLNPNTKNLQFTISPPISSKYLNHDAIFWQAPISTTPVKGALAEIGYFVQWTNSKAGTPKVLDQAVLCRFFVNPNDTTNFQIYSGYVAGSPCGWLSSTIIGQIAPANNIGSNHYRGLFLENVLGMWVSATDGKGNAYNPQGTETASASPYYSWTNLPAYVQISLVCLDASSAEQLKVNPQLSYVRDTLCGGALDANAFVAALPAAVKNQAAVASIIVSLDNAQ